MMIEYLVVFKIIFVFLFLLFGAWKDYKTRLVTNKLWLVFGVFSVIVNLVEYSSFGLLFIGVWLFIAFFVVFGFCLCFYIMRFLGGADVKAFLCIGLAFPFASPAILFLSFLFASFCGFYNLARNLGCRERLFSDVQLRETHVTRFFVLMSGRKVDASELAWKWWLTPLEDNRGKFTLRLRTDTEPDLEGLKGRVWVSYGIPLVTLIFTAFLVVLTWQPWNFI